MFTLLLMLALAITTTLLGGRMDAKGKPLIYGLAAIWLALAMFQFGFDFQNLVEAVTTPSWQMLHT